MKRTLILVGAALWLLALTLPVFPMRWFSGDPGKLYADGFYCLSYGALGVFSHGMVGWFSNLGLFAAGVILWKGDRQKAKTNAVNLILVAILFSLSTFWPYPPPPLTNSAMHFGRESVHAIFFSLGIGYWVWLSSIFLVGIACLVPSKN